MGVDQSEGRFDDPNPPDFREATELEIRAWLQSLGLKKKTQQRIISVILDQRSTHQNGHKGQD